jgi:carboxymethylenebutenolidase
MRITLPSGTPAELATPDGTPTRGVALHPDIMGLRPLFDELCATLAREHGWAVCAIEPFPGGEEMPLEQRLQASIDVDRVLSDLAAAAVVTECERVAVMGFCMGGMQAFRAAGHPVLRDTGAAVPYDRAVSFYGMIVPPPQWSAPERDPLDLLVRAEACPTLAILGGRDKWTPPDAVEELRALPNIEIALYAEADHGFVHDASRPAHRADDAADAWRRVAEFLA